MSVILFIFLSLSKNETKIYFTSHPKVLIKRIKFTIQNDWHILNFAYNKSLLHLKLVLFTRSIFPFCEFKFEKWPVHTCRMWFTKAFYIYILFLFVSKCLGELLNTFVQFYQFDYSKNFVRYQCATVIIYWLRVNH